MPYQDKYINKELLLYMQGFDLRIGTLECAIGTNLPPAPDKLKKNGGNDNICYARDEDFKRIVDMGFSAMSLGNNHAFDLGEDGLKNTIEHLQANGIGFFGAGMNVSEASKPYIVSCDGKTLGLIGCCIKGCPPRTLIVASENSYGVYQPTIEELEIQIKELKGRCDYILIMPHWGEEHVKIPHPKIAAYARRMIDAGADAVLGSHTHCISPIVSYKKKCICFSMGNFLDPDKCLTPPRPFYYPENKEEVDSLPKCVNYPWSVKQPTLCVSGKDTRIGWTIMISFLGGLDIKCQLVHLDNNNVLGWYRNYSRLRDCIIKHFVSPFLGQMTKLGALYRFIYKLDFIFERKVKDLGDFRKNI